MKRFGHILIMLTVGFILTACNVTRHLKEGEYLVQKVKIESDKELPRKERITSEELKNYLRQSPNRRLFGMNFYVWMYDLANPEKENGWNNFKRRLGEEPVILDMNLTKRSADNFKNYMDSRGFFRSQVDYEVDTTQRPKRAILTYRTRQGQPYRISSLDYDFRDPSLKPFVMADTAASLIHIGEVFDIATLNAERERITSLLRSRGYYEFTINNIEYVADTLQKPYRVGLRLIIKKNLKDYNERGEAILEESPVYRIRRVNLIPYYNPTQIDTLLFRQIDTVRYQGLNIYYGPKANIRPAVFRDLIPIRENQLYNANQITRTYDKLMSIGYLKSARISFSETDLAEEQTDTVRLRLDNGQRDTTLVRTAPIHYLDCNILCTPAQKQSFKVELEGSVTSSFYGLSTTVGYQNRNIFRGAEALDLNFSFGYEYMRAPDARKRNATEFGISAGLSFPRFLLPFRITGRGLVTPRTKVNISVNFQDRPYYRRTLSSASWGYSWDYRRYSSFTLRPADITIVNVGYLDQKFYESLQNAYLQNSYQSQLISALSFGYTYNNQRKNLGGNATNLRVNAEIAGNLLNLLEHTFSSPAAGSNYYELFGIRYSQYFRIDVSASRKIMLGEKSAIAGRLYAGFGYAYGNAEVLPMDRLFYAGGSNSMRGWTPRTLGPGTTPTPEDMLYPTQLGDMRLEANLEFRFPIWGIFHGATFLDVGNIWFMRENEKEYPSDAVFHFKDFYKGLGFNTGIGIRLDIKFAVLRLDWGIQLHNPNQPAGERWIHNFRWDNTALNFGVGYPF